MPIGMMKESMMLDRGKRVLMHQPSKQGINSDNTRREDDKNDYSTRIWDARE